MDFLFLFFFTVSHSMWDLSCPTRDWTHNPYIGSTESQPLGHQGSPNVSFLDHQNHVAIQSHSIITLHFYFLYNSSITFFLLYYLCLFICFIVYVKEMATNWSILAWKILWTEEPIRLQSMGLQRAGHNWATEHIYLLYFSSYSLNGATEQELKKLLLNVCGMSTRPVITRHWKYEICKGHNISFLSSSTTWLRLTAFKFKHKHVPESLSIQQAMTAILCRFY